MTVLVVYPDAGTGGTTVDGFVTRKTVDETFSVIRAGSGVDASDTAATFWTSLKASTTSNQFQNLFRGIQTFDTSLLGDDSTITDAIFSVKLSATLNELGGSPALHVCSSTPASDNALVSDDYSQLGSTSFASIAQTSVSTVDYNNLSLNSSGLANINKTGISRFGTRISWDINNSFDGIWASNASLYFLMKSADQTGTTDDPKLTITYTPAPTKKNNTGFAQQFSQSFSNKFTQ